MRATAGSLVRAALIVSVNLVNCWAFAQKGGPLPADGKVGLVTRGIQPTQRRNWRGAPDHVFRTTVWYPAVESAIETPQVIGPPDAPLFSAGSAMPHAAFAPALNKLPLILISHGTGGSAEQMAWLGTALARAGFMAAAIDHPGNNAHEHYTQEGFALWWERATDLSEVLDGLLADPELGPHIDHDRIGAAGFSLGGYTAMELGGARTDVSALTDLCHKPGSDPVCQVPEAHDLGSPDEILAAVRKTSGESLARSADSFRDPRVRAVFGIAPALGFTLTPESLKAMRLPVEVVVGSADPIAPAATNASLIRQYVRGARETVLPGVSHYTFLADCLPAGVQTLPQYCTDPAGVDREATHRQVDAMAVQFFVRAFKLR